MRKQLYLAIIAQLKLIKLDNNGKYYTWVTPTPVQGEPPVVEPESAIKHFDIWNNNLQYIEETQPFDCPAVFLQFQPITWEPRSKGVRGADVSVTLHIITANRAPSAKEHGHEIKALEFFDLLDAINYNLYNLKGDFFRYLTSLSSATDHDHDELIDSMETYSVQVTDKSAVKVQSIVIAPTPKITI